ncbi:MAG TPA: PEP-utilizing enzyme [Patescibacteria group bacterium]|nr:PEP-utilizing enzyme [Patescibacteria group bacterium]
MKSSIGTSMVANDLLVDPAKRFSFLASRPQSIQRDEMVYLLLEKYQKDFRPTLVSLPLEGDNRALYVEKKSWEQLLEHLIQTMLVPGNFEKHLDTYQHLTKKYAVEIRSLETFPKTKKDLLTAYQSFLGCIQELADYLFMPFAIEKILSPRFHEQIMQEEPVKGEDIFQAIGMPTLANEFQKMRIEICDAVLERVSPLEKSRDLSKKFGWYGEYSYVEPLLDSAFFLEEMGKMSPVQALEEKTRILYELEKGREEMERIFPMLRTDQQRLSVKILNTYTFLRSDRIDLLKKIQCSGRIIFESVAEFLRNETSLLWTRPLVVSLLNAEIISYLSDGIIPAYERIPERKGAVYYRDTERTEIMAQKEEVDKIVAAFTKTTDKTIKGMIAFKGVAAGPTVLVFNKQDLKKVKPGMILIARTTMPDYTHAMKIAAAFVTEEGGITSHAAIIARELKKPCIVGTGNCTKLLKDGDLVEVDAEKGIVKIL